MEPRDYALRVEQQPAGEATGDERFAGYAVIGLPFQSGHVLGLRRFPASSLGPAYTSIWHRDPAGDWVFIQNVEPNQACSRYFGRALSESLVGEITIAWTGPRSLIVTCRGERDVEWWIALAPTLASRLMNAIGNLVPERLWHSESFLRRMGSVAGRLLRAGRLTLVGQVPNGQRFLANPRLIWIVADSSALLNGKDLGSIGRLPRQATLGEFRIPQRGIFGIVNAFMETFDPARHSAAPMKSEGS